MSTKILVTTTSTLQGYEINKYYGYISSNFVTGADFLMDFFAGFTDFFGGVSGAYTEEVDAIKTMAVDSLELKAQKLGMNGIVGLKIDIDPIFGGASRSMFMVSASGTAVLIEGLCEKLSEEEKRKREMLSKIRGLGSIQEIINTPNKLDTCTAQELEVYLNGLTDDESYIVIDMVLEYCKNITIQSMKNKLQTRKKTSIISEYLQHISRDKYIDKLNGNLSKEKIRAMQLLDIIDYSNILDQFKNSKSQDYDNEIISVLSVTPQFIEKEDCNALGELIKELKIRYNKDVETKKVGMISKKDMWLCKKCKSPIEMTDNMCTLCRLDKYGLPSSLKFESKVNYLESIYKILLKYK